MRKLLVFFLAVHCLVLRGQSDTIYTKQQRKIACKIEEVGSAEIKYRLSGKQEGPLFVVPKSSVLRFTLADGYTENILKDELSVENEHELILANRDALKFHPFGVAFNHISFAYEKVIRVGMNLDIEGGYINSSLTGQNRVIFSGRINENPFYSGFYLKPGVKFFPGRDFNVKDARYAHPLKGWYIRLELACSHVSYSDISFEYYNSSSRSVQSLSSDLMVTAYGGFISFGRQFILGNLVTLDAYAGGGMTGQSHRYSNPAYPRLMRTLYPSSSYHDEDLAQVYQYHGFLRNPQTGLSVTLGLRLGIMLPQKGKRKTEAVKN